MVCKFLSHERSREQGKCLRVLFVQELQARRGWVSALVVGAHWVSPAWKLGRCSCAEAFSLLPQAFV